MDFFDFLFGENQEDNPSKVSSSINNQSSMNSTNDLVEQFVRESVSDLKKHTVLDTKALEAEAIYLAAFLYLKGTYQIDFELDYLSEGLVNRIPSKDFSIADKVFSYMIKYGEGFYGKEERDYGINGYKMNIQICSDYGSHIKKYFIKAHEIGSGKDYYHFSSPRNCLWRNGVRVIDSPTQRDVYYKFDKGTFEFMIPPYNPLVIGRVVKQEGTTLRCESNDGKRTFVFHFIGSLKASCLDYIEMYRNDKGDMVSYHKNKKEENNPLDCIENDVPFVFHFKKMLCTLRNSKSSFMGTMIVIEDPLDGNLTANISYDNQKLKIELPKKELIKERGDIDISSYVEIKGSFEKFESSYAPICYKMNSNGIKVQLFCKRSSVFSFIEIPVKSKAPRYRDYDTLHIELDLLQ